MSRNKEGLHSRQAALLRYYLDERCTVDEALKKRNVKPSLFQKWLDQPAFKKAFERRRATRALLTEENPVVDPQTLQNHLNSPSGAPAPDPAPAQPDAPPRNTGSVACGSADAGRSRVKPDQPPMTEREWVYSINGEQGVKAYDQLVAIKRQLAQSQTDQPPPQSPNPDPGASASVEGDQINSNS
jgi:hypothetical protein